MAGTYGGSAFQAASIPPMQVSRAGLSPASDVQHPSASASATTAYGSAANLRCAFYRNSPGAPAAAASQYKINVNRTKTKKWVEAKTQDYGGDDWGADYDEEPEADVKQPDPEPPAPRSAQGTAPMTIPSPSGPPPPFAPPPPLRTGGSPAPSPGARTPSGPPLYVQTQPITPGGMSRMGPAETGLTFTSEPSRPGRETTEEVASPLSGQVSPNIPAASGTPGQAGLRGSAPSPSSERRMSPAPQSATHPVPTRFPPRKSSMGQQDLADLADGRPRSGSRPGSSHRPWTEGRSASPLGPRSPQTPGAKPHFIRPADIYKRVPAEKEKERRSMESARLSLDSNRGSERTDSPVRAEAERPEPTRAIVGEEASDPARLARPPLATVAERKSEYGLDVSPPQPKQPEAPRLPDFPEPPTIAAEPKGPAESGPPEDDLRRFSSSPKLPDLARMSMFGEDLFSGTSSFLSDAPPVPTIPEQAPEPAEPAEPQVKEEPEPVGPPISTSEAPVPPVSSPIKPDMTTDKPLPGVPPIAGETKGEGGSKPEAAFAAKPEFSPGSTSLSEPAVKVTSVPTNAPPGPARPGPLAGEVSPISEGDEGADIPRLHNAKLELPASDVASDTVTEGSSERPSRAKSPAASHHDLPPLRTQPKSSQSSQVEHASATPTSDTVREPHAPDATLATDTADIPPTAPLKPRRGDVSPPEFVPPQSLERFSTMSTATSSPKKESDHLREEIIKSLSPTKEAGSFSAFPNSPPNSAGLARESTYLHNVYDDYYGDDKTETDAAEAEPVPELPQNLPPRDLSPVAEAAVQVEPPPPEVPALSPRSPLRGPAAQGLAETGNLRKRFSWEADGEDGKAAAPAPAVAEPLPAPEPKSLSVVPPARLPTPTPANSAAQSPSVSSARPSPAVPTHHAALQLQAGSPTAGVPHPASQAGALSPLAGSTGPEPPSPVSVLSDGNVGPAKEADSRRLSLADEKAMAQSSSHAVARTPPPEQHPALARPSQPPPLSQPSHQPPPPGGAALPTSPPGSFLSFRQCMSYATIGERIQALQETRERFATTDQGLAAWVEFMAEQPEHATAAHPFRESVGVGTPAGRVEQMPQPATPNPQQPYYQQYLNASSSNIAAPAPAPRPQGGPQPPSQFGNNSDFKHSGAQVGAKSKELLMAAGKAGKGLFSKGKSKLRGTGDKVFF